MSPLLAATLETLDLDGAPDPKALRDRRWRSLCVAERVDIDELEALLLRTRRCGAPATEVCALEHGGAPDSRTAAGEPHRLIAYMVENGYKNILLDFDGQGLGWFPPEDYHVLFFAPDRFDAAVGDAAAVRVRFEEWLGEWHHSERGRAHLRALREKYDG